jgi:hypothetical protein
MKIGKGLVTLIIAVVGGIILQVTQSVFTSIGNQINDLINPTPSLDTKIDRVTDSDNKDIEEGNSTKSTTVKAYFTGYKNNVTDNSLTFVCRMDQEDPISCSNGEPFSNLGVKPHRLSVKAIDETIGEDGLSDTIPDIFDFNTITSASIDGKVKDEDEKPQPNVNVRLNKIKNETTGADGGFIINDIPDGDHSYKVDNQKGDLLTCGTKKVNVGDTLIYWTIDLGAKPNQTSIPESSSFCKFEQSILPANYELTLNQIGVRLPKALQSSDRIYYDITLWVDGPDTILERIANVTYFLNQTTFNPSVIPRNNPDTKFALSLTAWGFFDINAKVYFKDSREIQDLSLAGEDWKFRPPNVL